MSAQFGHGAVGEWGLTSRLLGLLVILVFVAPAAYWLIQRGRGR